MALRLRSLLLLLACAPYVPLAHGAERAGDAARLYELEQYASAVDALETEFLALIEAAPGEERFHLYWTYNHLTGSWFHVECVQTQLELSVEAQADSDEESLRTILRDQAEFVRWELGQAIDDLEQAVPQDGQPAHLWINETLRSLLSGIRRTIERLWTGQCAHVPCVADP
jgi:hypothetical protein